MTMKRKALAAAIALAVAAPAGAAIDTSVTGDGELFFSIWDPVSETSYTRDLGLKLTSFLPGSVTTPGYSISFTADATLNAWLSSVSANVSQLQWNVAAMDGSGQNRYLTTSQSITGITNSQTNALNDAADIFIANTNSLGTHPAEANGSNVASKAANGNSAYAGGTNWGANWGLNSVAPGFTTSAAVGEAIGFWLITATSGSVNPANVQQYASVNGISTWSFADGTLTYASPVPVPAAFWLLGSGLLSLVGVARRRKKTA